MKLHRPEYLAGSCGITMASILTGESFDTISKKVLKIRNRYPSVTKGHTKTKVIPQSTDSTYLWELIRYLKSSKIKVGRFNKVSGSRLKNLGDKYKEGTFLLNFRHHVAILMDNVIYDNGSGVGQFPYNYQYRKDVLDGVALLSHQK